MIDLKKIKSIHLVGIKGVAMTALACLAQDLKIKVSGSDTQEVFVTDRLLKKRKIKYSIGFLPEHVKNPNLVIYTGAHEGQKNPEVQEAIKKKIMVLNHAQALKLFLKDKEVISVCGVGGKTTTSSMIAIILKQAHLDLSWAIGVGEILPSVSPGRAGQGKYFVVEADEYVACPETDLTPRFLYQNPKIIVCTNIEFDHPDVYQSLDQTKKVFLSFLEKIPQDGLLVANIDNQNIREVIKKIKKPLQTYGLSPVAQWHIKDIHFSEQKTFFSLLYQGVEIKDFVLNLPGKINVLNATAAIAVANFLGLDFKISKEALKSFFGTKRRFERIAQIKNLLLYDDYAHHPKEINATLEAARSWFPNKKIITIFQPHTYSRTKKLFAEFTACFKNADTVILTPIYASSREKKDFSVSSQDLVNEIKKHQKDVYYADDFDKTTDLIQKLSLGNDIIITMGAGNIFHIHPQIIKALSLR
jgi:UDP-N-acetylmuramate--alanine ligase